MIGRLLVRGMLVGLVAALLSFGFLKLAGEPPVDRAIASLAAAGYKAHPDSSAHPGA